MIVLSYMIEHKDGTQVIENETFYTTYGMSPLTSSVFQGD